VVFFLASWSEAPAHKRGRGGHEPCLSKRDNTSANVRESSVTQQPKSQAAPIAPSAASGQTQATATTKGTPEAQRTTDSKKLATTNSQGAAPQQEPARSSRKMLELRPRPIS
jgi:hypothetical protein